MKCLYCDKTIDKYSLKSLLIEEDALCTDCRKRLSVHKKFKYIDNIKVETFYEYDGMFKQVLLQYKECYDEALAQVFLYCLSDYISLKYHGYKLLFVPSSKSKLEKRGFNHLQLIFKDVRLKTLDGLIMKEELIQEGKNYEQRQLMKDNYIYEGPRCSKVLIIDDVLTTGASIKGVYKAIKPYADKVKVLCLACKRKRFHS